MPSRAKRISSAAPPVGLFAAPALRLRDELGVVAHALEVLGARVLDTGYLTPSARIWVWRCGDQVVIEWDNRGTLVDDKPVWTATRGRCELERSTYVREIRSFHDRLMARMADRVDSVTKSWRRSDVLLDPDALRQDCRERATWLDAALARPPRDRDWSEIARVLAEHVKRGAG